MKDFKFILILLVALTFSCSDEKDNMVILEDDVSATCANTEVFDPNFTGTACCSQRNSDLALNSNVAYEYFTNLPNPSISWQVKSGDIEIVSGGNASVVTIKLGSNFTEGQLYVLCSSGDTEPLVCGHPINISRK